MRHRLSLLPLTLLFLQVGCVATDESTELPRTEDRADSATDWQTIQARCQPPAEEEENLYSDDYRWGYTSSELDERYQELYHSPKRLFERARYNAEFDRFEMPHVPGWGGTVVLSERLVESVRMHIEKALDRKYVQAIIFPDMGHAHLFVPEDHWEATYAGAPVSEFSNRFTALFDDPELKVLYHTAEQLTLLDDNRNVLPDPDLQWRHYTRNLVGDNRGTGALDLLRDPESRANTSHTLEGHRYHGAGFSVSANQNGCFPFVHQGETYYFDLSLSDAPRDPSLSPIGGGQ